MNISVLQKFSRAAQRLTIWFTTVFFIEKIAILRMLPIAALRYGSYQRVTNFFMEINVNAYIYYY